jgi:diguanylate cyclase (GGDEF)-like protein
MRAQQNESTYLQDKIARLESEVERLRQLTERDDLTGCLRRDAFVSLLERRRSFGFLPKRATVAVVDLDHFKRINDVHGHAAGDEVLVQTARLLTEGSMEGTLVCRMGGEEFVLVLPCGVEAASAELERLRLALQQMAILTTEGKTLQVTASFGAVSWDSDTALKDASIQADMALYQAKNQGRNRVVVQERRA